MTCSISVFGAILVVTAVTPTIIVAVAALSIVYYRVQVTPLLPIPGGSVGLRHAVALALSALHSVACGNHQEKENHLLAYAMTSAWVRYMCFLSIRIHSDLY